MEAMSPSIFEASLYRREPFSLSNVLSSAGNSSTTSPSSGQPQHQFGVDYNYIPLNVDFTVNFGGIYNYGQVAVSASAPP